MSNQPSFKDHFSGSAAAYTRFRPTYPPELFAWLASLTARHELAWDCGCGNGQAARALVQHYRQVVATDPSREQIANAAPHPQIDYRVGTAEASGLAAASIDLIVVAQALHWFDFARFYAEARRVTRPDGVLAAISYGEVRVAGTADAIISRFYHELIGPYWPPERHYVDEHYRTIPFPFAEIQPPAFAMEADWTLHQLCGYLGTWSAVKEFRQQHNIDPLTLIAEELAAAWGEAEHPRRITWPLALRVGRIADS